MPQDLTGKVVAVTGGASGMGAAIATMLAQRGASVSIADVQEAALGAIKNTLLAGGNTNVLTTVVDVRDEAAVDAWIAATVARFGRLDGAANFAGVIPRNFGRSSVRDQETADWDYVLSVNLTGLMYCMRAQLRVMAARGSIVNAASISGLFGYPNNASYGAAKFGVVGLTKCAAKEAGPDKAIRVNCIAPWVPVSLCIGISRVSDC